MTGTTSTHNGRLERRLDLLLPKLLKVNVLGEEGVILNFLSSVDTQSSCRVTVQ